MPTEEIVSKAPEIIYVSSQSHGVDWFLIANIILIFVTVVGWIIVYCLNLKQQRENLKDSLKMKVYEEFWGIRKDFQDNMSYIDGPPFVLMESIRVPGLKYNELEEKQKSIKYFQEYLDKLYDEKRKFNDVFMNFWRNFEMWECLLVELDIAKKDLISEYTRIIKILDDYICYLQKLDKYSWESWDRGNIEKKSAKVYIEMFYLYTYIDDMMKLIHNELVNTLFDYKKPTRKPLENRFRVLTKNGLIKVSDINNNL